MKQALVASLMLLGSVSSLSAADYTWNKEPGETWQNWADPANWLVAGETATAAPGAEDTVKQPIATSGSTWCWDLGGGIRWVPLSIGLMIRILIPIVFKTEFSLLKKLNYPVNLALLWDRMQR